MCALDRARTAAAPVLQDEDDEQRLDEDEDRRREAEDEVVGALDMGRVRRRRRDRREAAVRSCGDACRRERDKHGENDGRQLATHPPGIL